VKAFLLNLLELLGWVIAFYIPVLFVMWRVKKARDAYEAEAKEPFTDLPLRLPGESTRTKADEHFEKAIEWILLLAAMCALAGFAVANAPEAKRPMLVVTFATLVGGFSLIAGPRVVKSLRSYWNYKLGFKGERVVAEELNQLLAQGWRVFHDVPFDSFNVDHVAVGPVGVFAVETKTRRKWEDRAAVHPAYKVIWDGLQFTWPSGVKNDFGLEQATRNAKTVGEFLSKSTGERVVCLPVLTLPGWYIEPAGRGTVIVAATKGLHKVLPKCGSTPLTPTRIQQIAFQLEQKCRPETPCTS
jgi:hypothetical protein